MKFLTLQKAKEGFLLSVMCLFAIANLTANSSSPNSSISLSCPSDLTVNVYGNSCSATVQLPTPNIQMVGCFGNPNLQITSSFGVGLGPHANVPVGNYKINYRAVSPCGDTAFCSMFVYIKDSKKPVPALMTSLYSNISDNGTVRVRAAQLNQSSYDNCADVSQLRYSFSATNPNDTLRIFTCSDLGMHNINVTVWDSEGNSASATTKIGIADNNQNCSANGLRGQIETPDGRAVPEVEVEIQSNGLGLFLQTDQSGQFHAEDLMAGISYEIFPEKNNDALNGVNAYDLYILHQHLVGNKPFTLPFEHIAADVNNDGKVSAQDLTTLQQVILGVRDDFPNNTSWRFIDKNYIFSNPNAPLNEPFPETIVSQSGNTQRPSDFWAVKTGDLNNSTTLALQNPIVERAASSAFQTKTEWLPDGRLAIHLNLEEEYKAFEATLKTFGEHFQVLEVQSNNPSLQTALFHDNLKLTWYQKDETQLLESTIFLTIQSEADFDAKALTLSEEMTRPLGKKGLMYQASLNPLGPQFIPMPIAAQSLQTEQNIPNPFTEFTYLPFTTTKESDVQVKIFDSKGVLVFEIPVKHYQAGEHRILLERANLKNAGIYTIHYMSDMGQATRKLMMF